LFFKTLKYEEVHLSNYETYEDVLEQLSFYRGGVQQKTFAFSPGILIPEEYEVTSQQTKTADRAPLKSR
jgi:hypothetical protein